MTDEVTLTIPRERGFAGIADLVVAGLGARHDVTVEALDDVQLALEGLLDRDDEGEVTVRLRLVGAVLEAEVGPFEPGVLEAELESDRGVGLRRLLSTVVDEYAVSEGPGGRWVGLRKELALAGAEGV